MMSEEVSPLIDDQDSSSSQKVLVLINPKSGTGKSQHFYQKYVLPFLIKNRIPHQVKVTRDQGYAEYIIANLPSHECLGLGAVVAMGGDGLIYEVLNGLQLNSHIDKPITIPLCPLPCGTGNGIALSIWSRLGPHIPGTATPDRMIPHMLTWVLDHQTVFLDIAKVSLNPSSLLATPPVYSALAISWGLISNIDILSESMRCLGNFRYTIQSIKELAKMESFLGTLSYHVVVPDADGVLVSTDEWTTITDQFVMLWALNTPCASSEMRCSKAKLNDGYHHLIIIRAPISRWELLDILWYLETEKYLLSPKVEIITTDHYKLKAYQGLIVIDGERIPDKEIEVKVIPSGWCLFGPDFTGPTVTSRLSASK